MCIYLIFSFANAFMLLQETSNMSLLMFGQLEEEKEKMIRIARKCFETANNVSFNLKLNLFITLNTDVGCML